MTSTSGLMTDGGWMYGLRTAMVAEDGRRTTGWQDMTGRRYES